MNSETNFLQTGIIVKQADGKEEIVPIPYNLNNILIQESDVINILSKYNVNINKINNIIYFHQSFTHKSYTKKPFFTPYILESSRKEMGNPDNLLELMDTSYERLEFLGDSVLKVAVRTYLIHRYPKQDEGFLTRLQTKIEDKKNLAIMSKDMGLGKYFIISKQIELMDGRNLEKMHEDMFESFIGALYLSTNHDTKLCLLLITNLLETLIDYSDKLYCDNNYKDQLIRYYHQQKGGVFPIYNVIYWENPPHKRKYIVGVEDANSTANTNIKDKYIGYGVGSSKKEGEQNAAKMTLIKLNLLNKDQYTESDIYYPPWEQILKNLENPDNMKYIFEDSKNKNQQNIDDGYMSDKSVN
jgi:ribonuclease-3